MYKYWVILLFICLSAHAQINENPLSITNSFTAKSEVHALEEIELQINVHLAEKHHAYIKQFKLKPKNTSIQIRPLIINPQLEFYDHLAKKNKMGIKNKANLRTSFEVPESLAPGPQNLKFDLQYQACTKEYCLMPIDLPLELSLNVINPDYEKPSSFSLTQLDPTRTDSSLFLILLGLFLAGFLTSFTPCIYPMIPITLAVLGSDNSAKSAWKKLLLSLSYVLGIALTYALLGVLAASTGGLFGAYISHPMVRAGIALLFVAMALSMFGLYEIQIPSGLRNKLSKQKFKQNYLGAFLTGLVAGVIASPCVGPVLISVLTFVAQSGDLYLGFLYLFVFALGLGLIFIFIGLFSHLLNKLPRSGTWMEATKFIFGSIMLAAACYYLMPLFTAPIKYIIPIISCVLCLPFAQKLIMHSKARAAVFIMLAIIGLSSALLSSPQLSFKVKNAFKPTSPYSPQWKAYNKEIYARASAEGKGIIIDFYADWCAACKELEAETFTTKEVHLLGQKFYWVKYDATTPPEDYESVRDKYDIKGLPHIVFYSPSGQYKKDLTLFGFENKKLFLERMKKALR